MLQYYLEFVHSQVELMSAPHSTTFMLPCIHLGYSMGTVYTCQDMDLSKKYEYK